jgi:hypothetical protein
MRRIGAAHFSYRGCEVTFFAEDLPSEAPQVVGDEDDDEDEDRAKRLAQVRKRLLDADIHGSA